MDHEAIQERFSAAFDGLIAQIKDDRSILAAILCGSLSHDTVWSRSDIDLVLVTVDDRKVEAGERALYADGLNVHALLMPRADFRKAVQGSVQNTFLHSFLAKGRVVYSHDPSLEELWASLRELGERDLRVQLLSAATHALAPLYKAHKWLLTRGDLDYTALYILYAATPLAKLEVIGARQLADREVIPQAMQLNPGLFKRIYSDLLNSAKTRETVQAALDAIDGYLAQRAATLFAPVLEHLREVGEARSATEIEDHFKRNLGLEGVTAACEYLADQGWIGKASTAVQLTKRSNKSVEELAFFHLEGGEGSDGR